MVARYVNETAFEMFVIVSALFAGSCKPGNGKTIDAVPPPAPTMHAHIVVPPALSMKITSMLLPAAASRPAATVSDETRYARPTCAATNATPMFDVFATAFVVGRTWA